MPGSEFPHRPQPHASTLFIYGLFYDILSSSEYHNMEWEDD
jgi:hypothetical protein